MYPRKSGCPFCALEIIIRTPIPTLKVNDQLMERALIIFHAGGSQNPPINKDTKTTASKTHFHREFPMYP
jgi:hypothetical protein